MESIAGRAAMLGFANLVVIELVSGGSPAVSLSADAAQLLLATGLLTITSAAILALKRNRRLGGLLLEAVMASLTSTQRAATSLSLPTLPSSLDASVDKVRGSFSLIVYAVGPALTGDGIDVAVDRPTGHPLLQLPSHPAFRY